MRIALLLLVLVFNPLRAADDVAWSPTVRGLQARLFTVPHQHDADWTYDVCIEFRNVQEGSAGNGMPVNVSYGIFSMGFTITDAAGHELARNPMQDMRMIGSYAFTVPPWGKISFPIGVGGGTPGRNDPPGRLLDFEHIDRWSLPAKGGPYQLKATYSTEPTEVQKSQGMKIFVSPNARRPIDPMFRNAWRGTLELPTIPLPQ